MWRERGRGASSTATRKPGQTNKSSQLHARTHTHDSKECMWRKKRTRTRASFRGSVRSVRCARDFASAAAADYVVVAGRPMGKQDSRSSSPSLSLDRRQEAKGGRSFKTRSGHQNLASPTYPRLLASWSTGQKTYSLLHFSLPFLSFSTSLSRGPLARARLPAPPARPARPSAGRVRARTGVHGRRRWPRLAFWSSSLQKVLRRRTTVGLGGSAWALDAGRV